MLLYCSLTRRAPGALGSSAVCKHYLDRVSSLPIALQAAQTQEDAQLLSDTGHRVTSLCCCSLTAAQSFLKRKLS